MRVKDEWSGKDAIDMPCGVVVLRIACLTAESAGSANGVLLNQPENDLVEGRSVRYSQKASLS